MKRFMSWAIILCVLIFGVNSAFAEDAKEKKDAHGKVSVGARVGYNQFDGGTLTGYEVEIDPSGCYGLNASYFVWGGLSIEGALEYSASRFNLKPPAAKLATEVGDIEQLGFLCTLRYQPIMIKDIMPYVGVGAGYYVNDFDHLSKLIDTKLKDDFGYHVAAGGEYHAQGPVWLTLDLRYVWTETYDEDPNVPEPKTINLDLFQAFVGMKLYF